MFHEEQRIDEMIRPPYKPMVGFADKVAKQACPALFSSRCVGPLDLFDETVLLAWSDQPTDLHRLS